MRLSPCSESTSPGRYQQGTGKEVSVRLAVASTHTGLTMLLYHPGEIHCSRCILRDTAAEDLCARDPQEGEHLWQAHLPM